jgi:hypothetical protein
MFHDALEAAKVAQQNGDIDSFYIGRDGDTTAGAPFIIAHTDQGSFVWWREDDRDYYLEDLGA